MIPVNRKLRKGLWTSKNSKSKIGHERWVVCSVENSYLRSLRRFFCRHLLGEIPFHELEIVKKCSTLIHTSNTSHISTVS